jgi:hypothetical protein
MIGLLRGARPAYPSGRRAVVLTVTEPEGKIGTNCGLIDSLALGSFVGGNLVQISCRPAPFRAFHGSNSVG